MGWWVFRRRSRWEGVDFSQLVPEKLVGKPRLRKKGGALGLSNEGIGHNYMPFNIIV